MCRLCFIWLCLWWLQAFAQVKPTVFTAPDVPSGQHKTLAIIPFYCIENPDDFSRAPSYMAIQEKQLGQELQHSLYKMMMGFSSRFSVEIQDIYMTNERLKSSGHDDYRFSDMKAIADVLNTDAIVWCVLTHGPQQFLEDSSLRNFLSRQKIPADAKRKDVFLSVFNREGICIWTLAANSEILRRMIYFEINRIHWFEWMQYMPYWKGDKIKLL